MNNLCLMQRLGIVAFLVFLLGSARTAAAHCDSLDGPIVPEAMRALETGDVTPVLKWIPADQEETLRAAFSSAQRVRAAGGDARALADQYFLETLVRLHRQGENAPYTGLRPAGSARPLVAAVDQALTRESIDRLAEHISQAVRAQLEVLFQAAADRRERASASTQEGRSYVEAYVDLVHFVESIDRLLEHAHSAGETAAAHER